MSKRDRELAATKYAGKQSASDKAREKKGSTKDATAAMRAVIAEPRSPESKARAAAHRANLPRLG